MKTLVLRFAGPLQSWGTSSKFMRRDTSAYPTFSGVIGLLSAALGRHRGSDPSDLTVLDMAVRVDKPGELLTDYHTVNECGDTRLTRREYLADAQFTVALTGDGELVDQLARAVAKPVFQLALGRRACVPVGPVLRGVVDGGADDAFAEFDPDPTATVVRTATDPTGVRDAFVQWDIPYTRDGRWHYRPRTVVVERAEVAGTADSFDPFSIID